MANIVDPNQTVWGEYALFAQACVGIHFGLPYIWAGANKMTCVPGKVSDQPGHPVWSVSSVGILWAAKNPNLFQADSEDISLGTYPVWVFAGRIGHFIGFIMLWLICNCIFQVWQGWSCTFTLETTLSLVGYLYIHHEDQKQKPHCHLLETIRAGTQPNFQNDACDQLYIHAFSSV